MSANKIAVVTGGSRGLGRDMALSLAKKGIDVILTYHSNASAAEDVVNELLQEGVKAKAFQLDTSHIRSFGTFVASLTVYLEAVYGKTKFDFLINNAGSGIYGSIADTSEEAFDAMMNIHFKGVFFNPAVVALAE